MLAYVGVVRLLVVGPGALTLARDGRPAAGRGGRPRPADRRRARAARAGRDARARPRARAGSSSRAPEPAARRRATSAGCCSTSSRPRSSRRSARSCSSAASRRPPGLGPWARAPAIVRGAVFFALAHVLTLFDASFATGAQRALFSFVALLPVGVALGWLFLARRSLYAAIGLHAAFNGDPGLLAPRRGRARAVAPGAAWRKAAAKRRLSPR